MAAGNTPLDAFTPSGKRAFPGTLMWGEKGLGGFGTAMPTRELSAAQIGELLRFLDSAGYVGTLTRDLQDSQPLRFPAPSADLERASLAFKKIVEADARRRLESGDARTELGAPALVRRYRAEFHARMRAASLAASQPGDLALLFDVASLTTEASTDPAAFQDLRAVYGELRRRRVDTRRTFDRTMLKALLAARRFDEAGVFSAAHPGAQRASIPRVTDRPGDGFRGRSVFDFDAGNNALTRNATPSPPGTQVVMVVEAGCHFSANALEAIGNDAALRERLRAANLLMVTPPRTAIPFGFIAAWNAPHPQLPLRAPFSAEEWRDIDVAGVPTFFILENGKVRTKITGWPAQGRKAELLQALDAQAR